MGEPAVMPFIERVKILATRLYGFFEGGNIHTIATSPDKLLRRTNQATFSDLRKSGIHKAFGEFVVHTRLVALQALAQRCPGKVKRGLRFSPFYPLRSAGPLSAESSQTDNYSWGPRNLRAPTTAITIKTIHLRIAPVPKTVRPIGSLSQAGRNGIELLNLRSPGPKAT
jgi:hypothetical protein